MHFRDAAQGQSAPSPVRRVREGRLPGGPSPVTYGGGGVGGGGDLGSGVRTEAGGGHVGREYQLLTCGAVFPHL